MNHLINLILISILFIQCSSSDEKSSILNASSGKIECHENFPSNFVAARNVEVWLPENYDGKKSFSVLYMHDGQMLFDATKTWNKQEWKVDEVLGELMKKEEIKDCIVVGVWNNNKERHTEYFPRKPFELLPQSFRDSLIQHSERNENTVLFTGDLQSDNYLNFLVEELKPFIDKTYKTKPLKENTFTAGSSMGGLISIYAICEYPEVFGGAACISTHWPGIFTLENNPIPAAFVEYLDENLPNPETHKIYFDYGTETLDKLYEPAQILVDSVMQKNGFSEESWITKKFEGHDHSETAWQSRLHIPMKFLLRK